MGSWLSGWRKLATVKSSKPDISSFSPSWRGNKNKLVDWKTLVDTAGIKKADSKDAAPQIFLKIYPFIHRREYRKSLTHFASLLSAEWYCPVFSEEHGNAEADN